MKLHGPWFNEAPWSSHLQPMTTRVSYPLNSGGLQDNLKVGVSKCGKPLTGVTDGVRWVRGGWPGKRVQATFEAKS